MKSFLFIILLFLPLHAATQFNITGPAGSGYFGSGITILPSGNLVITDPTYDITTPQLISDVGAVFLYNGMTGELISTITGSCANDNLGIGGVKALANGNYVVSSQNWDLISPTGTFSNFCLDNNGNAGSRLVVQNVGASTLGDGAAGISGRVSSLNSLTGSFTEDRVGNVVPLSNGNYLVQSAFWNGNRGAVTLRSGLATTGEVISETNSLIGDNTYDYVGNIKILSNGNYVIYSASWNQNRGAVTFCTLAAGCFGTISSSNSLIGNPGDKVGYDGVSILPGGGYVVISRFWNSQRGAVTFGSATGVVGVVGAENSLIGGNANDYVGSGGVTPLANGGYVINSNIANVGAINDAGAITFGNAATGISGVVGSENSLVGSQSGDFYRASVTALTNGNYVVSLPSITVTGTNFSGAAVWGRGTSGVTGIVTTSNSLYRGAYGGTVALANGNYVVVSPFSIEGRGAVTWGNGSTGTIGMISEANSLVGSTAGDQIGLSGGSTSVTALTNGNYVVNSDSWDNGQIPNVGAATFCNGATGCLGSVSPLNSLIGSRAQDQIGFGGATALANGNYVVRSYYWDNSSVVNAGAVTFGNGTTGTTGEVSPANSLVGGGTDNFVGMSGIKALPNGNYVVTSISWNNRGAVTWGNGATGTSGVVSAANSIVGSAPDDRVGTLGNDNSVKVYSDSSYTAHSANWDNAGITDAGAVSLGKGNSPVTGEITANNSVRGTAATTGTNLVYDYSPQHKCLVVGPVNKTMVSVFRYESVKTVFDFDGDAKTDLSIYRPPVGEWWHLRSSDGQNRAFQFGTSSDKIVPADFTGDGKTDVAIYRPSSGEWFVLRSEDESYYSFPFGTTEDIPAPGDFDGDGKADAAVFRPSTGTWYISRSLGGTTIQQFGQSGDVPVVADYDGDGKSDIAVYRVSAGEWWVQRSTAALIAFQFGNNTDKPVQGDYTGDGKADVALFRPSSGEWFVLRSENQSYYSFPFGTGGDIPAPGDYDGDGQFDAAVFRPSGATWYVRQSTSGVLIQNFGAAGDVPVPNAFVP